jgi:hypothetical protein
MSGYRAVAFLRALRVLQGGDHRLLFVFVGAGQAVVFERSPRIAPNAMKQSKATKDTPGEPMR